MYDSDNKKDNYDNLQNVNNKKFEENKKTENLVLYSFLSF
jgi:hypothetical protein